MECQKHIALWIIIIVYGISRCKITTKIDWWLLKDR